jgi:hypothetical protein
MKGLFFLTIALLLIGRAFYYFGQIGQSMVSISIDYLGSDFSYSKITLYYPQKLAIRFPCFSLFCIKYE